MPPVSAFCRSLRHWLAICVGVFGLAFSAQADDADSVAPALKRGINLSNWFTEGQRLPLKSHDMAAIKQAGFDHVRIPINPELLGFSLADASTGMFVVGGALAAAGAAVLLFAPSHAEGAAKPATSITVRPTLAPGYAGVGGSF